VEQEVRTAHGDATSESAQTAIIAWARRAYTHLSLLVCGALAAVQAWQAWVVALCARQLQLVQREVHVLTLVARDARTPWFAKLAAALSVGYTFSPIQLIPNVIPVLGSLDDVVALALRLTPPDTLAACRERAGRVTQGNEGSPGRRALLVGGALWLVMATIGAVLIAHFVS